MDESGWESSETPPTDLTDIGIEASGQNKNHLMKYHTMSCCYPDRLADLFMFTLSNRVPRSKKTLEKGFRGKQGLGSMWAFPVSEVVGGNQVLSVKYHDEQKQILRFDRLSKKRQNQKVKK